MSEKTYPQWLAAWLINDARGILNKLGIGFGHPVMQDDQVKPWLKAANRLCYEGKITRQECRSLWREAITRGLADG